MAPGIPEAVAAALLTLGFGAGSQVADLDYPIETSVGIMYGTAASDNFCKGSDYVGEARIVKPLLQNSHGSINLAFTHHSCFTEEIDLRSTNVLGIEYRKVWR